MDDVRCPMCGKLNSAERDTCQYCDARLKPLIAPQGGAASGSGTEAPDWLDTLRSEDQGELDAGSERGSMGEETDWLARLGDSQSSKESEFQNESEAQESLPDWFQDLGTGEDRTASSSLYSEEQPAADWMTSGQSGEEDLPDFFTSEPDSTFGKEETSAEGFDSSAFGTGEMSESEEAPPLDWFSSTPEQPETQDWFSSQPGEQPWESEQAEEIPDFSTFGAGEPESGDAAQALDWFSTTPEDSSAPDSAEPFDASAFGSSDFEDSGSEQEKESLPDWLASTEAVGASEEAAQPESFDGDPGWLMRVRARQQAEQQDDISPEPTEGVVEKQGTGFTDWLSSFSEAGEASTEPQSSSEPEWETPLPAISPFTDFESPEGGEQGFDWSAGGLGEPAKTGPAPFINKEVDESPDWLKSLTQESQAPTSQPVASAPDITPPSTKDQEAPDWLSTLSGAGEQTPGGSVPAFVVDEESEIGEEITEPFTVSDSEEYLSSTPDWLSQVTADDATAVYQPPAEAESEEIARADLPTWLEAMRPVEAVAPEMFKDTTDSRVESIGPLAGLRGTLPAELEIKDTRKPPPYSLKLAVSDDVQVRLDALKSLLEAETQAPPPLSQATFSPQLFLRLSVFAGFLLAVIWALWSGPLPSTQLSIAQTPQHILDFQSQITRLQPGAAALIAVDYEPGYSFELESSLEAILQQLAEKNNPVYTLSSSTAGAIQAERALVNVNASQQRLQNPYTMMVNLGYLPGGPAGLLAFASNPSKVIPSDMQGDGHWADNLPSPQGGLDNFSVIIVATERAETARTWIEQIGPLLERNGIALLMITSAQSEPVIRSYYTSSPQLVDGFISGLTGGALYENILGQFGTASTALDGYSAAILVSVIFILLGSLFNILVGVRPQVLKNNPAEEKA